MQQDYYEFLKYFTEEEVKKRSDYDRAFTFIKLLI